MITNQYTLDLSCVKNNRSFFADQEYRKAQERIKELEQTVKHLNHVAGGHKAHKTKIKKQFKK